MTFSRRQFYKIPQTTIAEISLKFTYLRFYYNIPGVNELNESQYFNRDVSVPHYNDVIMSTVVSQITSLTIVYSTIYLGAHQRRHQSSASLAFVRGIHRWPVNSPHKRNVTRKMFSFDDVIMSIVVPTMATVQHALFHLQPGLSPRRRWTWYQGGRRWSWQLQKNE